MNSHEIERIAAAAHQLRPDWPAASLRTFISKNLADRPRRDVAVALTWVACEPGTTTPARVLETGPWWRAAAVEGTTRPIEVLERHQRCGICNRDEQACRGNPHGDHEFEPDFIQATQDAASRIDELRREAAAYPTATGAAE